MSICTDKTIVIYALGRYSPLFILSVQSKFCLLFDNCVHVFVYDALRIKVVAGTLMVVETEIFHFFFK